MTPCTFIKWAAIGYGAYCMGLFALLSGWALGWRVRELADALPHTHGGGR